MALRSLLHRLQQRVQRLESQIERLHDAIEGINGRRPPTRLGRADASIAMLSLLRRFGLHSTCLSEEVSRPFWWGEGKNEGIKVLYSTKIGVWLYIFVKISQISWSV